MRPMQRKILNGIRFCKYCGSRMLFQGYNIQHRLTYIMNRDTICYTCAFWQDILEYPPECMEIIGNKCMKIYPVADKKDKSLILGGKGKMRYFVRHDLSVFQSNDIWLIGMIPENFRDRLKPTAKEITQKTFTKLQRNPMKCKARGCFDRYHCLRYNLELENNGAFNSVPLKWKVGDEHCKFFIDIDNSYIDDSSVTKNPQS